MSLYPKWAINTTARITCRDVFRKPIPILFAILLATIVNHGVMAVLGQITTVLSPTVLLWIVSLGFIGMAGWMLIPDELDDESESINKWQNMGSLVQPLYYSSLQQGDKTQIATVALAARFDSIGWVTIGTTLGIMLVNAPAVFIGNKLADKLPIALIHKIEPQSFLLLVSQNFSSAYFLSALQAYLTSIKSSLFKAENPT